LRDANRQLNELSGLRIALEAERDQLAKALADAEDNLRDVESRLHSATSALEQLKVEFNTRLREKEDELEAIK
jgi:predicted  nucleic acid-binding Zn-ribbon protein